MLKGHYKVMNAHENRPETPNRYIRERRESGRKSKDWSMVRDGAYALVVLIHVPPVLSAVGPDARVDADAGTGQHCCAARREKGGDALDSF